MRNYLGVSKIAKITGKPRTTILRWLQAGKFGDILKVENEYQVPQEQFSQWWDQNMKIKE